MHNFEFYSPTRVVFGKGTEAQVGNKIKDLGLSRAFVIHGSNVAKSAHFDNILQSLNQAGIAFELCSGVVPNPRLSFARQAVKKALDFKADFVLAIGGGSVIDTAKAVADGLANPEEDIWEFWSGKKPITKSTPVGVVLTISAAGSETSASAVLTNEEIGQKRGVNSDFHRPKFAIMNPELTFTLPDYQIGCGVVDIIMHTLDRYFTPESDNDMTDGIAEALMRNAIKHGKTMLNNKTDYQAASELMWAGSLSHNGITGLGGTPDMSVHQLSHEISARFDLAHGASLSALWGSWAIYVYKTNISRFVRYANNVWGISLQSDEETALAGIKATVDYFKSLNMPICFADVANIGVLDDETLRKCAEGCTYYGGRESIGSFKKLYKNDMYEIYKLANTGRQG